MAAIPELSFGDFSKEEFDNYLCGPTCVELPPLFGEGEDFIRHHFFNGDSSETTLCFFNGPVLTDDNENHIIPEASESCKTAVTVTKPQQPSASDVQLSNGLSTAEELHRHTCLNKDALQEVSKNETIDVLVNGHLSENEDDAEVALQNDAPLANGEAVQRQEADTVYKTFQNSDLKRQGNSVSSQPPKEKSWASLFSGSSSQTAKLPKPAPVVKSERTAVTPHVTNGKEISNNKKKPGPGPLTNGSNAKSPSSTEVVEVANDVFSKHIADQISKNEIVYKSPGLMPRGFINSSNWCYINALDASSIIDFFTILPFDEISAFKTCFSRRKYYDDFHTHLRQLVSVRDLDPIFSSYNCVRLVKELKPLPKKGFQRAGKEQFQGTSYEPEYIYKMLSTIKSKFSEKGRQEDAEEFLSCVLNGLHEEMLKVCEFHFGKNVAVHGSDEVSPRSSQSELGYEVPVHEDEQGDDSNEEGDQWEEVTATRKNRSSVTRRADISKTPVSDLFRGELRSDLFQEGLRATATLEPFFTLPLDINDQKPRWSVNEALDHLTQLETVQDFTNARTKTKGEATRRITLETLPPVLILHLKRFIYDKEGGSLKIDKEVQYHTDLVIGKELLSKSSKKLPQEKRSYKLFAVVYHHGKAATGGHYTTDVYHDGLNCWLRIDDQVIKMSKVHEVVRHDPQRTAYLLYYKRTDLMAV